MKFDQTMFYGRARRMAIVKTGLIIGLLIFLAFLGYKMLSKEDVKYVDRNVNFAFLRDHFKSKGYSCDRLERDGGRCVYEVNTNYKSFTRYGDGFIFLIKSNSYTIQFRHVKSTANDFVFYTNESALVGERNKTYYCLTSNDIFGDFVSCSTEDGEVLETKSYIGALEVALIEMNEFIDASGYDRDKLINDFEWQKK